MTGVVVTGAAGFLGSHVADLLEVRGYQVVRSDIFQPPDAKGDWKLADLRRFGDLVELTRKADVVCHIGGIGDVYLAEADPKQAMEVNGLGTANFVEAARRNGVSRFVYASTWEVYGKPKYEPMDENHPCWPGHPYSISKLAGDLFTQSAHSVPGLSTVVLRLGTAYGPRMRENAVIQAFILRALRGLPLEIRGTGEQFRQFTHASDIAAAFVKAISLTDSPLVFNIVSPEWTSIRKVASIVAELVPSQVVFRERRQGDPPPAMVSSRLADSALGWKPQISFQEGLQSLVEYFRQSFADQIEATES